MFDPNEAIRTRPMSRAQIRAVAVGVAINAMDGYDVMSISLAAPGLAASWGIDRGALGIVLAMELIGMALGSFLLGRVADRVGRRLTILGGLAAMTVGMALCATAPNLVVLACWRFITGLGIGGLLPALTSMVTEVSNDRRRDQSVVLLGFGYAMGAILGGAGAAYLLQSLAWPSVFVLGSVLTGLVFVATLLWVPETIVFLAKRQPNDALSRINAIRVRFGHEKVDRLFEANNATDGGSRLVDLFASEQVKNTALITMAYFFHISTFYFVVKWLPKIVTDMGHSASTAASVLVFVNIGGLFGSLVMGLTVQRYGVRRMAILVMALSTAAVALLGRSSGELGVLMAGAAITGLLTNAAVIGLFAVLTRSYPSGLRATGLGFTMGLGRGGSALAPIMAGVLFSAGLGVPMVALIMGCGSIIAAALIATVRPLN